MGAVKEVMSSPMRTEGCGLMQSASPRVSARVLPRLLSEQHDIQTLGEAPSTHATPTSVATQATPRAELIIGSNREILVKPTPDMATRGATRWQSTVVGYYLGKWPYFSHFEAFTKSTWPAVRDVTKSQNALPLKHIILLMPELAGKGVHETCKVDIEYSGSLRAAPIANF
ncbi:hypothetical protein Salat_2674300 [Sesamum alatum]|uniref:Uncharacterized protein n=1 Tax=Sesamum alatum TaxID=300844 RepID=A0AAE2CB29_9LAMI|nr:hypothetical protein Salat_2674300 [Sesamum alatum]